MASASSTPVELLMTAGLPYSRRIRVVGAALVWPTNDSYEVRGHLRVGKTPTTELIADLGPFLTKAVANDDILVTISLTGAQTRALPKGGYYDIIVSDVGMMDVRALPILSGKVKLKTLVTGAFDG